MCELTEAVGAAQPRLSRHLARLRELGLVIDQSEGLWIYYRTNPDLPEWLKEVLRAAGEGRKHEAPFVEDAAMRTKSSDRQGAKRCA